MWTPSSRPRAGCETLSEELTTSRVKASSSGIRFFLQDGPGQELELQVQLDPHGLPYAFDSGRITVPHGFSTLSADDRAWAGLAVVRAGAAELARLRGWDASPLSAVKARVVARGLRYSWVGPWRSSPGRRHGARCSYRIADDGLGRVQLEVRAAVDGRIVARTDEAVAFGTREGLQRSARTLRWRDRDVVTVVPWCGLDGDDRGLLEADLRSAAGVAPEMTVEPAAAPGPLPLVRLHLLPERPSPDEPPVPWLEAYLEHDAVTVPGGYWSEFRRVVDLLCRDAAFEQWWASTPFQGLLLRVVIPSAHDQDPLPPAGVRNIRGRLRLTWVKHEEDLPERHDVVALAPQHVAMSMLRSRRPRDEDDFLSRHLCRSAFS